MSEQARAAIAQAVLEIARVRRGETAVVSGQGPMGLLCLKLLVADGVKTIVAGMAADRERLDAARRFGAAAGLTGSFVPVSCGPFYPVVKPLDQDADLTGTRWQDGTRRGAGDPRDGPRHES